MFLTLWLIMFLSVYWTADVPQKGISTVKKNLKYTRTKIKKEARGRGTGERVMISSVLWLYHRWGSAGPSLTVVDVGVYSKGAPRDRELSGLN